MSDRIANQRMRDKVMSADEAAQMIGNGAKIGMSGFTGAAYPKAMPTAIANRAKEEHAKGNEYGIDLFTGASTAPDCDGVLAEADAVNYRMPYASDPIMRKKINDGSMARHSPVPLGRVRVAGLLRQAGLRHRRGHPHHRRGPHHPVLGRRQQRRVPRRRREDHHRGQLLAVPRPRGHGRYLPRPPPAEPHPHPDQQPGRPRRHHLHRHRRRRVVAVIETDAPTAAPRSSRSTTCRRPSPQLSTSSRARSRRPPDRHYVMQSGVGNVPNAVMAGLLDSSREHPGLHRGHQDGMIDLIDAAR